MTRVIAILAVIVAVAALGATYLATRSAPGDDLFAQCSGGQVAGGEIGGPFELVDKTGKTVTDTDIVTEPTLIYFGYTFCPDVCPLDTTRNVEAVDILESRGQIVTPVFISIDPERDTPEVVGEFAEVLHERMIGLTGSADQVKAASQAYKTYYKAQPAEDEYYLVDHSTFSYLTLPDHGTVGFFRRELTPEQLADTIGCFLDKAGT